MASGLDELRERIEAAFEDTLAEVELLIPYSEGGRLHELHEIAGDLERTERDDGVLVRAKVPSRRAAPLRRSRRRLARVRCRGAAGRQAAGGRNSADAGPRRRRGARPIRQRVGPHRARREVERRHRSRHRDPRRARRPGTAALGTGQEARHHLGQQPRSDRLRLPGRAAGTAAQHRPGRHLPGRAWRPDRAAGHRADRTRRAGRRPRRSPSRRAATVALAPAVARATGSGQRRLASRLVGGALERVVEGLQVRTHPRSGAPGQARSGGRRARRSWAAAGRAGKCRSGCRGARPRGRPRRCCQSP